MERSSGYGLIMRKNFMGSADWKVCRLASAGVTGDHAIGAFRFVADCTLNPP